MAAALAPLGSFRLSPSVLMMLWIGLGGNHCAPKVMPPSLLMSRLSFARRSSSVVSGGGGSLQGGGDSHNNNNNNNDDRSSSSSRGQLLPDLITSPQSKTIKTLSGLLSRKKRRDEMGEAVAEGPRMVLDLIRNPRTQKWVRQVVVSDAKWDAYATLLWEAASLAAATATAAAAAAPSSPKDVGRDGANDAPPELPFQLMRATPEVLDSCTDTVTNQGIVARVRIPTHDAEDAVLMARVDGPRSPLYVVLDGLQDPGNVGTLIRSCVATGAAQVLLLPGCADVWSPKALRSAMGTTFLLPVRSVASFDDCLETLRSWGCYRVYAATMMEDASTHSSSEEVRPSVPHGNVDWTVKPTALVIGSEGNGLSREVRQALGDNPDRVHAVHVPMLAGVESLNAAVCGSVILFERLRQLQQQSAASVASAAAPESSEDHVDQ
jgi:RNA methyltransferase, TrmH family